MKKRPDYFLKLAVLLTPLVLAAEARADLVSSPWPPISPRPESRPSYISAPPPFVPQFYSQYDIFSGFSAWIAGVGFLTAGCFRGYQVWKAKDPEQRGFLRRLAVTYILICPVLMLTPFLSTGAGLPVTASAAAFAWLIGTKPQPKP